MKRIVGSLILVVVATLGVALSFVAFRHTAKPDGLTTAEGGAKEQRGLSATRPRLQSPGAQERKGTPQLNNRGSDSEVSLPAQIEQLLRQPPAYPATMGELPLLDGPTQTELMRRYRALQELSARGQIARLLAFGGDATVVDLFIDTMTREYSGRYLAGDESATMIYLPVWMGILARRQDAAYDFLVQGSNPDYWKQHRKWKSDLPNADRSMVTRCIVGMGYSGRSDAWQRLLAYRNDPEGTARLGVQSAVVDAVFAWQTIERLGFEAARDQVFRDLSIELRVMREWRSGPDGAPWVMWKQRCEALEQAAATGGD